jgi:hypothetical protein
MKKMIDKTSIFCLVLIIGAVASAAIGQATGIAKEEFDKEIDNAWQTTEKSFPRRETYSNLERSENVDGIIIFSQLQVREFLAKDKIRYEFSETSANGKTVTKKLLIGSLCYELDGKIWRKTRLTCDPPIFRIDATPDREEFLVENSTLNSNPVKIIRTIQSLSFRNDESTYLTEYLYYLDSAGRILKREFLTKQDNEERKLVKSTDYEYDIKISPINPPSTRKSKNKR